MTRRAHPEISTRFEFHLDYALKNSMSSTLTPFEMITAHEATDLKKIKRKLRSRPARRMDRKAFAKITAVLAVDNTDYKTILGDFDVYA